MSSGKVGVKRGVFICKNIYNRYSDLDAKQFMYASGISNNQIKDAIYRLCIDLKMAGIFTKCTAIYPFVGGTATTHRFNLRDPRDLDAAFRLQFFGGGTHSANGYQPNGTNGYANTFFNTLSSLTLNNAHLSYYSRFNTAVANEIVMGNLNGSNGASGLNLVVRRTSDINSFRATEVGAATGLVNSTVTDSRGFFLGSITSSTSRKTYKNGVLLATNSSNITYDRANAVMFIGCAYRFDTLVADFYTNKECAFASIGTSLTDAEAATYNTIVNNFQVTLNRNV